MTKRTERLVTCSLSVALATVLSMVRLFRFPFGGSVTLCCMLFVYLPAWLYGIRTGLLCGLLYGLTQFVTGPYFMSVPQFLFDYVFAFTVMGLGGYFANAASGLEKGYIVAVLGRWIMAGIAGLIWVSLGSEVWDGWAPLPYSLCYNGCYIFAEALITLIVLRIPAVRKALLMVKERSRS